MTTEQRFDWSGIVDYAGRTQVEVPKTQYQLTGITAGYHPRGIPVEVPPLWHTVVTARLAFPPEDRDTLREAQARLATALDEIERIYPLTPHGVFIQVAYGPPYFRERIPAEIADAHMPNRPHARQLLRPRHRHAPLAYGDRPREVVCTRSTGAPAPHVPSAAFRGPERADPLVGAAALPARTG